MPKKHYNGLFILFIHRVRAALVEDFVFLHIVCCFVIQSSRGACGGLCISTHCVLFCHSKFAWRVWKTLCFYTLCVVLLFRVRAARVEDFVFLHIVCFVFQSSRGACGGLCVSIHCVLFCYSEFARRVWRTLWWRLKSFMKSSAGRSQCSPTKPSRRYRNRPQVSGSTSHRSMNQPTTGPGVNRSKVNEPSDHWSVCEQVKGQWTIRPQVSGWTGQRSMNHQTTGQCVNNEPSDHRSEF